MMQCLPYHWTQPHLRRLNEPQVHKHVQRAPSTRYSADFSRAQYLALTNAELDFCDQPESMPLEMQYEPSVNVLVLIEVKCVYCCMAVDSIVPSL
jgi:hypothetical protein